MPKALCNDFLCSCSINSIRFTAFSEQLHVWDVIYFLFSAIHFPTRSALEHSLSKKTAGKHQKTAYLWECSFNPRIARVHCMHWTSAPCGSTTWQAVRQCVVQQWTAHVFLNSLVRPTAEVIRVEFGTLYWQSLTSKARPLMRQCR
jgi:hypothetical protein